MKKFGIFTPYSLNLYSETNEDNPANFLKRNAVLFDKLVLVPLGIGSLDGSGLFTKETFLNAYSKEDIKYKKEFSEIIFNIEDFVSSEDELKNYYNPKNMEVSMWGGDNSSRYIDFIMKYVQEKNGYTKPDIQSREHKKELEYYIGTVSMDFQVLTEASMKFSDFSGLYSELHEKAYIATYGTNRYISKNNNVINSVEDINHFDFGTLSWDEIIILRKSEFVNDFRKKVWEWTQKFNTDTSSAEIEAKIDKYIDDAKFDFIEKRKPNLIKSILTGILGNIPLPIPINPISIYSSGQQVLSDYKSRKEFGWLLFIQKARNN